MKRYLAFYYLRHLTVNYARSFRSGVVIFKKRLRGILTLLVFLLGSFAQLLIAPLAYADLPPPPAGPFLDPRVEADAKMSIDASAFYLCMTASNGNGRNTEYSAWNYDSNNGDGYNRITANNIATGSWFSSGTLNVDRWYDYKKGSRGDGPDCGSVNVGSTLQELGLVDSTGAADYIKAACKLGLTRTTSTSNCETGNTSEFALPDATTIYNNLNTIATGILNTKDHTGGYTPNDEVQWLNDVQYYLVAWEFLNGNCKMSDLGSETKLSGNATITNTTNDILLKVVDQKGNISGEYYNISNYSDGSGYSLFDHTNNEKEEWPHCSDIVNKFNSNQMWVSYANWVKKHQAGQPAPVQPTGPSGSGNPSKPTCTIPEVGWIVCPVVNFLASITQQAYGLTTALLTFNDSSADINGPSSALYQAWSNVRNVANVAFIIAFLMVIYSQITGAGISNYGIKKMLPRIIIAAILVNISYWICLLAVDLSNIVGSSMDSFLSNLNPGSTSLGSAPSNISTGNGWEGLAGGILAGTIIIGTGLYFGLSVLIPALLIVLITILVVVFALIIREALIILLIVISPLAFVAYLLPNTDQWFKKWRELFQSMLLIYPIIGVIFGASALAAKVLYDMHQPLMSIMGAIISIAPLMLVPAAIKGSHAMFGKLSGAVNNRSNGLQKRAQDYRQRRQDIRGARAVSGQRVFGGGQFRRQARREAVNASAKNLRASAANQYIAGAAMDENGEATRFGKKLAGGGAFIGADAAALSRALGNAKITIDEATAKEVKAEAIRVQNMDTSQLKAILGDAGSSEARKAAAMQRLIKTSDPGGPDGYADEVNRAISSGSETLRRVTAESLSQDGPKFLKGSDIDRIATGAHSGSTLQSIASDNVKQGVLSQEKMADETPGNIKFAFEHADTAGKQVIVDTAAAVQTNPQLSGKIKHNAGTINAAATGKFTTNAAGNTVLDA